MTKRRFNRETRMVLDFMNADFIHESGKRDKEAQYLLDAGLSVKQAREIQQTMLAAYQSGTVTPFADAVRDYADLKEPRPSKDRQRFEMLWNISGAKRFLYVSLLQVVNDEQFFSLKRCAECSRFFPDGRKRQYCSDACLRKKNSRTAQERVERLRAKQRFDEVFPKLLKLQKMKKTAPFSKILDSVPGFDPKLLALIVENKEPLKELVSRVKYRNRRILMEAKL